jgi:hypothetical protein
MIVGEEEKVGRVGSCGHFLFCFFLFWTLLISTPWCSFFLFNQEIRLAKSALKFLRVTFLIKEATIGLSQ